MCKYRAEYLLIREYARPSDGAADGDYTLLYLYEISYSDGSGCDV